MKNLIRVVAYFFGGYIIGAAIGVAVILLTSCTTVNVYHTPHGAHYEDAK